MTTSGTQPEDGSSPCTLWICQVSWTRGRGREGPPPPTLNPSEEACGPVVSGSTPLVSHTRPDCRSHLTCRPHSWFLFQRRGPPSEGGGGETRRRPCWKDLLLFHVLCQLLCYGPSWAPSHCGGWSACVGRAAKTCFLI